MRQIFLLLSLLVATSAHAGLFTDDDARKQIQQLEDRVFKLNERSLKQDERILSLEGVIRQQTRSMLDLQTRIEELNSEIRKLYGYNEELTHGLHDAEKREKDFYVDLDTRLRHLESMSNAAQQTAKAPAAVVPVVPVDPEDPALDNRSFEAAYTLFKSGSHANAALAFQEHLNNYPGSAHAANATYWLGSALFALNDYNGALDTFREFLKSHPGNPKAPDVLFYIAGCQQELKQDVKAKQTLKQLISKYPASEAAAKAKKLIVVAR